MITGIVTTTQYNQILDNFQNQVVGITPQGAGVVITGIRSEIRGDLRGLVKIEIEALLVNPGGAEIPIADLLPGLKVT